MWRAFFSAIGIVLIILGLECLAIDSATFVAGAAEEASVQQPFGGMFAAATPPASDRVFRPTEWFPWSLLAVGSITLLYSISLRPSAGPA
jgi:LPS sulfotransferase NodH